MITSYTNHSCIDPRHPSTAAESAQHSLADFARAPFERGLLSWLIDVPCAPRESDANPLACNLQNET